MANDSSSQYSPQNLLDAPPPLTTNDPPKPAPVRVSAKEHEQSFGLPNSSNTSTTDPPNKKIEETKFRFLTPAEWAIVAHGVGGVIDSEGNVPAHPRSTLWPPHGLPVGLYRQVITARTKCYYRFHCLSMIRWLCMLLQIFISATLTAIGSVSPGNGTVITVLAAINTITSGVLAFMHNSGFPDRYRSDKTQLEDVEDHLIRILDTGLVEEDFTVGEALANCFDRFREAKETVRTNMPASYIPNSALHAQRQHLGASPSPGLEKVRKGVAAEIREIKDHTQNGRAAKKRARSLSDGLWR